jgi:ankyrin repeat protein
LAEYYGETRIQLRLKTRKMFRDVTVGTRTIRLSELLAKQQENNVQELKQGTWCMRHQIKVHTTIKNNKKVTRSPATPSLWLRTAKSAHNSLAAASSTATGLNITAEKQKLSGNGPFEPSQTRSGTHHYVSVPAESNTTRKGTDVTVHVEFRLVQLQSCLQTSLLTARDPTIEIASSGGNSPRRGRRAGADSPPVTPTSRTAPSSAQPATVSQQLASTGTAASTASTVKEYAQMSELQFLAVTAPSGMVVEVMRALARQDALPAAMELRHVITADPAVASIAESSAGAASNAVTGVGAVSGVNAGTRPRRSLGTAAGSSGGPAPADNTSGLTAFELALLHRQETTVLEMLQRCGGLCFNNITVGRGSPLHAAVRGGSAVCVEYVGRYLRKYGARRVTGPGARLWMSSLQAKLEWRDAQDDTALAVACRSAPADSAHAIAIYLLILGADAAAVNTLTNYTPLMYACQHGPAELVSTLLSIQKSPQDILDGILNVGDVNSILNNATMLDVEPAVREELQSAIATAAQTARSSALANHLYSNSRSSNILRGRNPAEGGYFNPLSTYTCDPTRRESSLGRNALHLAVQRGDGAIVQLLLNIGMSCAEVDYRGDNSLHIAARRGDKGIISLLADAERTEWTAHKELIKQGKSLEVMRHRAQALLKRNCVGDTPVDVALEGKHFAAAGELLRGAIKAYGTVPLALAQSYYDRLQICAPPLPLSPVAGEGLNEVLRDCAAYICHTS